MPCARVSLLVLVAMAAGCTGRREPVASPAVLAASVASGGAPSGFAPMARRLPGSVAPARELAVGDRVACVVRRASGQPGGKVRCWGERAVGETTARETRSIDLPGIDDATEVVIRGDRGCVVRATGRVLCWESEFAGEFARAPGPPGLRPVAVAGVTDAVAVSVSLDSTCARLASGAVACWGVGESPARGGGETDVGPAPVAGLVDAVEVVAGEQHHCARRRGDETVCWRGVGASMVMAVGAPSGLISLGAGRSTTCGAHADGAVRCWRVSPSLERVALPVALTGEALDVAIGAEHGCARFVGPPGGPPSVRCWGGNERGQRGDGSTAARPTASEVAGLVGEVRQVAAGAQATCALTAEGRVFCWGDLTGGVVGTAPTASVHDAPVAVAGLSDATAITAGGRHACAVRRGGSVVCWGANQHGQLHDGSLLDRTAPVTVDGLTDAASVTAGRDHTCMRDTRRAVHCWGDDSDDQLGHNMYRMHLYRAHGSLDESIEAFDRKHPVTGLVRSSVLADQLAASGERTCSLMLGTAWCWGGGSRRSLSATSFTASGGGFDIETLPDATGLAVGDRHACALQRSGRVVCWGRNDHGQLGRDGAERTQNDAGPVRGLSDAVEIVARRDYTCARRRPGGIVCWGLVPREQAPAGGGVEIAVYRSPTAFPSPADVVELAAGDRHVCARTGGGHVVCWGDGRRGQLGGGSADTGSTTMTVADLSDARALALGSTSSCALRSDGTVACWGDDSSGQLGDGGRHIAASASEVPLRF